MADNIAVTPGTGATIATDDVGGIQYQRVKVGIGADGSAVDLQPASAAVQAAAIAGAQAIPVAQIGNWTGPRTNASPAVSAQATTTQPAGAAGVRHVCTSVSFGFSPSAAVAATT